MTTPNWARLPGELSWSAHHHRTRRRLAKDWQWLAQLRRQAEIGRAHV